MANVFDATNVAPAIPQWFTQFDIDLANSSALSISVVGGTVNNGGTITTLAETIGLALTANATNYICFNPTTGLLEIDVGAITSGNFALYSLITNANAVVSCNDLRIVNAIASVRYAPAGIPTGLVNGINKTYLLPYTPKGSVPAFINSNWLVQGTVGVPNDFYISGNQLITTVAYGGTPGVTDVLSVGEFRY